MIGFYDYLENTRGNIFEFYKSCRLSFLNELLLPGCAAGSMTIELALKLIYFYDQLNAQQFRTQTVDGKLYLDPLDEAAYVSFYEDTLNAMKKMSHNLIKVYETIEPSKRLTIEDAFEDFTQRHPGKLVTNFPMISCFNLVGGVAMNIVLEDNEYFSMRPEGHYEHVDIRAFMQMLIDAYNGRYVNQYNPMYSYKSVFLIDLLLIELIRALDIEAQKKQQFLIDGHFAHPANIPTNEIRQKNIDLCCNGNLYLETVGSIIS